mmetsp:Transcript_24680/g.38140  ORF Transcript_24680/g.38140 Transcript_24680/m.38140 type:complete len:290 (-) Transcript_24680:271-1140(-)
MCSFMRMRTVPSPGNLICIPKNTCSRPRVTDISPNSASIACMTLVTTPVDKWEIKLSSTHHAIVHCFPLICLFATHLSYGLSSKPICWRVPVNSSYHKSADFMHPYNAFNNCIYKVLRPFSSTTNFLYSGFLSHSTSTICPWSLITTNSSISACKYAPRMSAVATSRPSCAATTIVSMRASFEQVGEVDSSLLMCFRCGLPSTHVRPLSDPSLFSLMRLMMRSASRFNFGQSAVGSRGLKVSKSSSCANSFISASIALSPCFSIPLSAIICVTMNRYVMLRSSVTLLGL